MRVYLASGLQNAARVRELADLLRHCGFTQTYDWTRHGSVQHEGPERIAEVATLEARGVISADVVIALLPGARGTHVEIGLALGAGVPVVLVASAEQLRDAEGRECAFYRHPLVTTAPPDNFSALADAVEAALKLRGHDLRAKAWCARCIAQGCRGCGAVINLYIHAVVEAERQGARPGEVVAS